MGELQEEPLTVIVPTHNRPRHCAAQLRFFKACGLRHTIVVADSSHPAESEAIRAACAGVAKYIHFDPRMADKYLAAVRSVETPFVVMCPDDDITLPHAIDAALTYLTQNPKYVVAHGYTLRFGLHNSYVDIHSVYSFTPSISYDDPLARHYHLMRRYQPYFWAVFRRNVLLSVLEAIQPISSPLFRELMFMNAAVLEGKVAMLPMIYALRGMEESHTPIVASHPLFGFLHDAESFFSMYLAYRNTLASYIRKRNIAHKSHFRDPTSGVKESTLEQVLDIVHATWLGREVDVGQINHAAQVLLGEPLPPLRGDPVWPGWRNIGKGDVVRSGRDGRRYVWRRAVVEAEPKEEIIIGNDEMARVEQELEAYRID